MWKAAKKVVSPREEESSYTDTYFREIGFKMSNDDNGSTESPDLDRDNAVVNSSDLGLVEDNSIVTEVERAATQPYNGRFQCAKSLRQQSPRENDMTMASAYGVAPFHSNFSKGGLHQDDDGVVRESPRYGSITLRDDASISTLGEESIRRKTPTFASQKNSHSFKEERQKAAPKKNGKKQATTPPPPKEIKSFELKPTRTSSTDEGSLSSPSVHRAALRRRRLICCLIAISLILLVAAGSVLGFTFMQLKEQEDEKSASATATTNKNTWVPRLYWTDPPMMTEEPTAAPVQGEVPTSTTDVNDPLLLAMEDLLQILGTISPRSIESLLDTTSPQFRALDWLSQDPEYLSYSVNRIVQRWTMAVLFYSLGAETASDLPLSRRSLQVPSLLSWDHECEWFSASEDVCNGEQQVVGINLRKKGLTGTIPAEIGLLQDTLEMIYLPSNKIVGVLPTELGYLSHLVRLQLTGNLIEGTIPTELAFLTKLGVLGLGRNELKGTIPPELRALESLSTLGLEGNMLEGSIPSELSALESLVHLSLESNNLEGEVPSTFGALYELSEFSIHRNNINGIMPKELCWPNVANETVTITADCTEIDCPCCAFCCVGCEGNTTGSVVARTDSPTSLPAIAPPFTCQGGITVDRPCYRRGNDAVRVTFENCEPTELDWIGLFEEDFIEFYALNETAPFQEESSIWVRGCGDTGCNMSTARNTITFGDDEPIRVKEGDYRVYLIQDGLTIATSEVFEVSKKCD